MLSSLCFSSLNKDTSACIQMDFWFKMIFIRIQKSFVVKQKINEVSCIQTDTISVFLDVFRRFSTLLSKCCIRGFSTVPSIVLQRETLFTITGSLQRLSFGINEGKFYWRVISVIIPKKAKWILITASATFSRWSPSLPYKTASRLRLIIQERQLSIDEE